ncbi:TPA: outer membrane protein [Legionella pneumophila]
MKPYLGAGIGIAHVDGDLTSRSANPLVIDGTSNELGYQFKAGLITSLQKSYQFFMEYRYSDSKSHLHKASNSVQPRDFINNSALLGVQVLI